jgi:hypothetical protein
MAETAAQEPGPTVTVSRENNPPENPEVGDRWIVRTP